MKVVSFENSENKHKRECLKMIDMIKKKIEEDEIDEFVLAGSTKDEDVELYVAAKDMLGAVGIAAIGLNTLLNKRIE